MKRINIAGMLANEIFTNSLTKSQNGMVIPLTTTPV
jgi:hypothetical protein